MIVFDTLRSYRAKYPNTSIEVKIYQPSIREIDPCPDDVCRFKGSIDVVLDSNQNFLWYPVTGTMKRSLDCGSLIYLIIQTQPRPDQIKKTIDTHRCKNCYNLK